MTADPELVLDQDALFAAADGINPMGAKGFVVGDWLRRSETRHAGVLGSLRLRDHRTKPATHRRSGRSDVVRRHPCLRRRHERPTRNRIDRPAASHGQVRPGNRHGRGDLTCRLGDVEFLLTVRPSEDVSRPWAAVGASTSGHYRSAGSGQRRPVGSDIEHPDPEVCLYTMCWTPPWKLGGAARIA